WPVRQRLVLSRRGAPPRCRRWTRCARLVDNELDDAALLASIAAGDEGACRLLVGRYLRNATLFAAQLTGDRDDAEDIVQSAFLVAIERAATLDPGRPFAPW